MEFSGQYLTYNEYLALGGTLDLMPFNLIEFEARNQINLRTQNRLVEISEIPQKVKICDFNLINKIDSYVKTTNNIASKGNIASENTDGYSVSYASLSEIKDIVKSKNNEIEDLIITDLYGVVINNEHIIYAGVK